MSDGPKKTISKITKGFAKHGYICSDQISTAVYLASDYGILGLSFSKLKAMPDANPPPPKTLICSLDRLKFILFLCRVSIRINSLRLSLISESTFASSLSSNLA